MQNVFKCNIVGGEVMARDEREKDGPRSIRNAFVAGCNAPQTNSAVLSPGGERAFQFMLTLQEAAERWRPVTDVLQRHSTLMLLSCCATVCCTAKYIHFNKKSDSGS